MIIFSFSVEIIKNCAKHWFLSILFTTQVQLQSIFTPDMRFIFLIPSMIVVSFILKYMYVWYFFKAVFHCKSSGFILFMFMSRENMGY